jgi:aerobic C4-dicarboxylate transport protein
LTQARSSKSFLQTLYFRVLIGIIAGVIVGRSFPNLGASLKPLGDGFLKLIRMVVTPVVFFTVVIGIAKFGDLRRLGRVGLKSLLYFESITTFALVIGFVAVTLMQPGRSINADPASLDTRSIGQYTTGAVHTGTTDFLLNIIPNSFLGAFTRGEMLQVLPLAILSGIALATLPGEQKLVALADSLSQFFFKVVPLSWKPPLSEHLALWPSPSAATASVHFSPLESCYSAVMPPALPSSSSCSAPSAGQMG